MDSINLATLFGPNILRRTKSGELKGDAADHMEENRDVIQVVQRLIDHHDEMFMVCTEFVRSFLTLICKTGDTSGII